MDKVIRIVLVIAVLAMAYVLYETIAAPVRYEKEVRRREAVIIERLKDIKTAQFAYREAFGNFTGNWDTLINGVKTGQIPLIRQIGEYIDSTSVVTFDTTFESILSSKFLPNYPIDSLRFVPFGEGVQFTLQAGTVTKGGVVVPVFMAEDPKPFNTKRALRVGSMDEATYSGNWE